MTSSTPIGNGQSRHNGSLKDAFALTLGRGRVASLEKDISLWNLDGEGWANWKRHLAQRDKPTPLAGLAASSRQSPLSWGVSDDLFADSAVGELIRKKHPVRDGGPIDWAGELQQWQSGAADATVDATFALSALAWAHALPALAKIAPANQWCYAVPVLLALAEEAAQTAGDGAPLPHQILAGELPLTLAYLLPEIDVCRQSAAAGRIALSEGLLAMCDGEGLPHGCCLHVADRLLATWTRSLLMGRQMKKGKGEFTEAALVQYEWLVRQMMRLRRPDGRAMLAADAAPWRPDLFKTALDLVGDREDRAIAKATLPGWKGEAKKHGRRLPAPAINSEWAKLALLRADWKNGSPRLLINYDARRVQTELVVDKTVVWSGDCTPQVSLAGKPLALSSDWEELCWDCDKDGDYVEIQAALQSGWKLQRQFYLARDDQFLLIADAILGPDAGEVGYRCRWPLAQGVKFRS
ncbi:MAG: hypothetical protein KDA41_02420, partial [Planctomycetales bacterium]|nr:hypothetical protein [Planctomycetales bacterium]